MTELTQLERALEAASIGKWKAYPAYKDSGVEWLGKIPEQWSLWKIARAFSLIGSGTTPLTSHEEYYDGDIPWVNTTELRDGIIIDTSKKLTPKAILDYPTLQVYPAGTLLVALYGATIGKVGILQISATTNQACCAIFNSEQLIVGFTFYWFLAFRQQLILLASGGGQPNISQETIRSLRVPTPLLSEQRAITAFLDRETTRINTLIAKKQHLIELLQEKRAALISHAVTKGLDPNVKMKDSGVEWLGEIPEHWKMMRVRDVTKLIQTGPFGSQLHSDDYSPNGTPIINPSHLVDGHIQPDWDCAVDEEFRSRLERHILHDGDIVFARRGEMGRCALVTAIEEGWLCGTGSILVRPDTALSLSAFLNRVLSTRGVKDWLLLESVGSTMDNLNTGILSRIPLPMPPLSEQYAINAFIDQETARIDALIARIGEAIEKLKEYSAALISAAVTGKIDVRGEVASVGETKFGN